MFLAPTTVKVYFLATIPHKYMTFSVLRYILFKDSQSEIHSLYSIHTCSNSLLPSYDL